MFSYVQTITMKGLTPCFVKVEVDISPGLPVFDMIGYLSSEVREARERVRTALKNSGISLPTGHITVNLAPAHVRKEGTGFDLAICLALLIAMERLRPESLEHTLVIGELGLNGRINGIRGVLPMVMAAQEAGMQRVILPWENQTEGGLLPQMEIFSAENLFQVLDFLGKSRKEQAALLYRPEVKPEERQAAFSLDFSDINGQETMKRATTIAAAGLHNILYIGTPGAGKTMIASRIPTILPPLSWEESLEVTKIYSISGLLTREAPIQNQPPFRAPHHTSSRQALAGGGRYPMPGEISLAHLGVLFLDELPEFSKTTLEILRQPMEEKKICLSRTGGTYTYPADFMLAAAMNPCKCGYYPDRQKCRCTPYEVQKYLGKISQPLLDRIDLCVEAPAVGYEELVHGEKGVSSADMRQQVQRAVRMQRERYQNTPFRFNSDLTAAAIPEYCPLSREGELLLKKAFEKLELSARGYHRILKTARTIADLEESATIEKRHISEAVFYRSLDKKYWGR
jgi:magnesium chelatase family protein